MKHFKKITITLSLILSLAVPFTAFAASDITDISQKSQVLSEQIETYSVNTYNNYFPSRPQYKLKATDVYYNGTTLRMAITATAGLGSPSSVTITLTKPNIFGGETTITTANVPVDGQTRMVFQNVKIPKDAAIGIYTEVFGPGTCSANVSISSYVNP